MNKKIETHNVINSFVCAWHAKQFSKSKSQNNKQFRRENSKTG